MLPTSRPTQFARFFVIAATVFLLLIYPVLLNARTFVAAQGAPESELMHVVVHRVTLERLTADHAELLLEAEAVPGVDAELQTLRLSGVRLDGTAVHVNPLAGHFVLRAGEPLELPRTRMVVYYTDLPTPSALDGMLAAHHARVTAEVRAQLQVSALSKLLMGDFHPVAALAIDEEARFDRSAVDPGMEAGIGLLSLAQQALGATASVAEQLTGMRVTVEANPVDEAERRRLLLVRTTFRTRQNAKQRICERLGIWLDAEHALVPAEALKPWAFSLDAVETPTGARDEVDPTTAQTVLLPFPALDAEAAPRAEGGILNFTVQEQGRAQESRVVSPARKQITVQERSSPGNFAVLHVVRQGRARGNSESVAGMASLGADSTDSLRVYRYSANLASRLRALELDNSEAVKPGAGTLHRLPRPVDSTVFGSPVLLGGELVGMVIGETAWISLPASARADVESSVEPELSGNSSTETGATQTRRRSRAAEANRTAL